jgi:hypothetical protein
MRNVGLFLIGVIMVGAGGVLTAREYLETVRDRAQLAQLRRQAAELESTPPQDLKPAQAQILKMRQADLARLENETLPHQYALITIFAVLFVSGLLWCIALFLILRRPARS